MNANFTCVIVDDEAHAAGLLSESIKGLYNNIHITHICTTWKDAIDTLRGEKPDILFLDISVNGKNGMDLLKIIPNLDSEIIFVTAYSEYAIDAFRYAATGYIVKPVGDTELSHAIGKALERIENKRLAQKHTKPLIPANTKLGIPNGNGINYFNTSDIIYFEAIGNYTKVVTKDGELVSSYNIGKYAGIVPAGTFFQVHRSYIVNLNCITRYESVGSVIMSNQKNIPVAKNSREDLLKLFNSVQAKNI
jgi:two-component system LytT family response regulator